MLWNCSIGYHPAGYFGISTAVRRDQPHSEDPLPQAGRRTGK